MENKEIESLRKENEQLKAEIECVNERNEKLMKTVHNALGRLRKYDKELSEYKELVAWLNSKLIFKLIYGKINL